ncbi:hypothetical protein LH464_21415 [Neorhizobium sp. T786]|uniref:hypothetical protein n=1 Tax=Pseudorhizobium xiangyangii TaxID=2883104 RepID=UPI001D000AF4|nr:hypothetical protein [Neorhizobium xiangyangii]MCB5205029.1 hypothetical protein [Neorhizobium xiangyangii]
MTYRFQRLGLSTDGRTNRWRLALPCAHTIEPMTTMYAQQQVGCERCGRTFLVDYNDQTMKEVEE